MSTEIIISSPARRRRVFASLVLMGVTCTVLFSGCIFAAVHAVRFVDRKMNPPQPALKGAATFFDGKINVTLILRSTEGRRRRAGAVLRDDEEPDAAPKAEATPPAVKPRMTLLTLVSNPGSATEEIAVVSVDSPLGRVLTESKTVALAGAQRVALDSLRSGHESNFETLTVSVTLKRGEAIERQDVVLAPLPAKKSADAEE